MTLVELLVVMIMGIVTVIALFAFQDLVLRQSTRVFARVDATQEARIAIEKIESRLHSACVAEGVTPILGPVTGPPAVTGSDANNLVFISKYGSAANVVPEKHVISLSGTTLTDTTYPLVSGSTPEDWVFSTTPATNPPPQRLLTNVSAPAGQRAFNYFAYDYAEDGAGQSYLDAAGQPFVMLLDGTAGLPSGLTTSNGTPVAAGTMPANNPSPLGPTLTAAQAQTVSAVVIKLVVDADGALGAHAGTASEDLTVTDSVVLRITPVPSDNNEGIPSPCQ